MTRLASLGAYIGTGINDLMPAVLPIIVAYFACRGLPWLIGVMAHG